MSNNNSELTVHSCIEFFYKLLFHDESCLTLDIYYNKEGDPKTVHDVYGTVVFKELRDMQVREIAKRTNSVLFWSCTSDAFAVISSESNQGGFDFDFKGITIHILKKTIRLESIANPVDGSLI